MRMGYVCSGLAAALVLFANASAEACSCIADYATGAWPRDGAVEVAVDTPLVVGARDLEPVTATLVAEDGTVVELQERRRLEPPGAFSCAKHSYAFFAAATELAPDTRYTFTAHFDKEGDGESTERVTFDGAVSFVTGTGRRDPAVPEVRLSLFGVPLGAQWGEGAGTLLDVYVETDAIEPLFVLAQGERDVLVHDLDPTFEEQPYRVGFGSGACAALTVADVTGKTIADEVLCEPTKCTRVDSIADSTCGDESSPAVGWSTWQSLPEGCGREALPQNVEEPPSLTPPREDVSVSQPSQVQTVGGCGLSARRPAGQPFAVSALLLAALGGLRRARSRASTAGHFSAVSMPGPSG